MGGKRTFGLFGFDQAGDQEATPSAMRRLLRSAGRFPFRAAIDRSTWNESDAVFSCGVGRESRG